MVNVRTLAATLYPKPVKLFDALNQNARLHGLVKQWSDIPRLEDRYALYRHLIASHVGSEPIDFLEFGVYRGESILWGARNHGRPESRFYGFDSFQGLPETWALGR